MKVFDQFRALLRAKRPGAAELGSAVGEARDALEAARSELERLRGLRGQKLTANENERGSYKRELAASEDAAEDAAAFLEELVARYAIAQEAEEEASKRANYDAAKAKTEAASFQLANEYPELGRRWAELLHLVAVADSAVAEANRCLPAGCPHLLGPEAVVRDQHGLERKVTRTEIVDLWCYAGEDRPLESLGVGGDRVRPDGARSGWLAPPPGQASESRKVELKRFRRTEFHPPELRREGPRLYEMELPGLRFGDRPFWPGSDHGRPNPGETEINLVRISSSENAAPVRARDLKIEWDPIRAEADGDAS